MHCTQVIPVAAVEAAYEALPLDSYVAGLDHARAMLEAAAPYMLLAAKAEAWEEGREYGVDECAGDVTGGINPYRKEAL